MVQLTEVEDEHFQERPGGLEEDEDDFTDTDSEISTDSDYDPINESLAERISALKDIIPPTTRAWFSDKFGRTTSILKTVLAFTGRAAWTVSVSALLVGIPYALAVAEEQQNLAIEQEQRMREMGGDVLTGGHGDESTAERVGAALGGRAEARPAL
ncbi:mitochondrial import receptor protein [Coniochaeta pulveracea]|uniref:Mitochondrial import receptor protein n=1 Tax=Coniochaeta pulveracea TaxID=177199 RepID=A0A420YJN8_9PEZI|nr:mitochondrial import receptor protein [Coniochaeta pulveracea]